MKPETFHLSPRDFLPVIIAGLLLFAAICGFVAVDIERIIDAVAVSEAQQ